MTPLLCAAALGDLDGIRQCRPEPDQHLEECDDDECRGCYPRLASVGFLCQPHARWVGGALDKWDAWASLVAASGGKLVTSAGAGGTPLGYVPLSALQLTIDECDRLRASQRGRHFTVWVSDEDGARDALHWARAAYRAYRMHETEETPPQLEKAPCPHCGETTVGVNPTREDGPWKIVDCIHCGKTIWRERFETPATVLSRQCDQRLHGMCSIPECACPCHE